MGGIRWQLLSSSTITKYWKSARGPIRKRSSGCFAISLSATIPIIHRAGIVPASTSSSKHTTRSEILSDARYDIQYENQSSARSKLVDEVNGTKSWQDTDLQNKLLSLLYVKCRQNVRDPGVDNFELERLTRCPAEHLEFHLWYLREKGWVKRTESGRLAITVEGIDRANSEHERKTTNNLLSDQSRV